MITSEGIWIFLSMHAVGHLAFSTLCIALNSCQHLVRRAFFQKREFHSANKNHIGPEERSKDLQRQDVPY